MRCTIHSHKELIPNETKYGKRYSCPVGGCTVVLWNGSTSTPADYATRQARIQAHSWFDRLWKSTMFATRPEAYKQLAKHLGLPKRDTHIGRFDEELCTRTIEFCKALIEAK